MTTPRLGAPELATSQTNKEETVNEQIRFIEAGAGHFVILDRDLVDPPASPADGDCYFIAAGSSPTGAWAGKANKIAFRVNTSWEFITPIDGFTAVIVDESRLFVGYNASTDVWDTLSSPSGAYIPVSDIATNTEQLTGTSASKVSSPDSIAALWEQGSDVASAATVSLGEGGYFNITGTTTITDVDFATDKAGRKAWVKFAGALTLTHNASTLILPTGANITTAAGDTACFMSEGSDVIRCVAYQRANGQALAASSSAPTESIIIACSDATTAITTGTSKVTFRMPYAFTLTAVRASVNTAPTGSTIIIDINESGSSVLSTKLSIDASEKTSTTAASAAVISDSSLADDAEITIDFDQVGSTIAGAGVKVYLIGHQ